MIGSLIAALVSLLSALFGQEKPAAPTPELPRLSQAEPTVSFNRSQLLVVRTDEQGTPFPAAPLTCTTWSFDAHGARPALFVLTP